MGGLLDGAAVEDDVAESEGGAPAVGTGWAGVFAGPAEVEETDCGKIGDGTVEVGGGTEVDMADEVKGNGLDSGGRGIKVGIDV